ncbi:DNA alkylation repair protein [Bizionia gelidisalsuginis]|jgi:3-methyladenine DNA glycosylase AlkD|uniref:DNA alkylation repair protein n=1 Tax=Bizionia gelidisalsuginis TaxID=291188 RepID=A0ABY3M6V3_9FLAO|nr:DNA alkylation repair protein [Bizionia gelidisalsuginis]TYC07793.1 DNA alkylation repair protein [Bizionia gelidisalsuginis]
MNAKEFIETLKIIGQDYSGEIPKREIFSLAKAYQQMPVFEVVNLLKDKDDNHRLGAVSILDWKVRNKKTSNEERKEIFKAYIENHNWIDNWGLVDRSAPYVVGGYLHDKDKKPLYDLAKSKNPMERRTAIVSTYYFIRKNEIEDTFKIAEILVNDKDEYVQKAVGSWIREAGKKNEEKLKNFLDKHATEMPRVMLRYAIEKFDKETREYYLNLKNRTEKASG